MEKQKNFIKSQQFFQNAIFILFGQSETGYNGGNSLDSGKNDKRGLRWL